jgi:hypothetical protein
MKTFFAKYNGQCVQCGGKFKAGELIRGSARKYEHAVCPTLAVSEISCLVCTQPAVKLEFEYGDDVDCEDFMVDYDRGCGRECNCGGKMYHITDFCSVGCVAKAVQLHQAAEG